MSRRVLITDDHPLVRRGLRVLLSAHPEWELCGEASNGGEAIQKAAELQPDVIIMDISMPGLSGLQATREIRALLPQTEVLILTLFESNEIVEVAQAAGALGYLVKTDPDHQLITALETVCRHEPFFPKRTNRAGEGARPS